MQKGELDTVLSSLYGGEALSTQKARYLHAIDAFSAHYGEDRSLSLFSVPGRSEISGNHTDHNRGCVLAAAVDLDIIAVAAHAESAQIRLFSEGFSEDIVSLDALAPEAHKPFSSAALIAGVAASFVNAGTTLGGLDVYTTSNVLPGSGLSSSAAFEVMIGNLLNHFFADGVVDAPTLALRAQYAENVFFGKPCGLMDQMACAVGGFVAIDFADAAHPQIEKLPFDLDKQGYTLCIVNTGGSHVDLNDDYAAIPGEMKAVAQQFGREVLRGLTTEELLAKASQIRTTCGDRAFLRALHFIEENKRVTAQATALRQGKLEAFFDGVRASGLSSFRFLQNVFTTANVREQGISIALALAEKEMATWKKRGEARVHGGGFAGTMQAYVPHEEVASFTATMEAVFGSGSVMPLHVRTAGATRIEAPEA